MFSKIFNALCVVTLTCATTAFATELPSQPLSVPAEHSPLAQHSLLLDAADSGSRMVVVGQFGHILYSDDNGAHWSQAKVPVSSTLTAVHFTDQHFGWAVGHDGVVLSTADGGKSWTQQLNGLDINQLILDHFQSLQDYSADNGGLRATGINPDLSPDDLELMVMDAEDFASEGASRPLMDVWFSNRNEGFIVGAYGLILRTYDGGRSWTPWLEKVNNPESFHYYTMIPAPTENYPEALFLVGEAGLLHRSLNGGQTWETLTSPYEGTFFGGLYNKTDNALLIYGLRGNLYRSTDLGSSWQRLDSHTTASIFDGEVMTDGSVLLVGSAGLKLTVDHSGDVMKPAFSQKRAPYSAVAVSDTGMIILAGLLGIELISEQESE